jgi:hypothetical protein
MAFATAAACLAGLTQAATTQTPHLVLLLLLLLLPAHPP